MKKTLAGLLCLAALLCLTLSALAEPAIARGGYTAYLSESNLLYLQDPTGASKVLKIPMTDIINVTDTRVYCLAQDGRLIGVPLDGSQSELVAAQATQEDIDKVKPEPLFQLEESTLTLPGSADAPLSTTALSACTNGDTLFWIERGENDAMTLKAYQLNTPGSAAQIVGDGVADPLSMIATDDTLTMVAGDHSVTVVTLLDRHQTFYPATSDQTVSAVAIGDQLLRYSQDEEGNLVTEEEAAALTLANNLPSDTYNPVYVTSAPTTAPSVQPTTQPTLAPTTRPVATQRPSSSSSSSNSSDSLSKGSQGPEVRKMQKRLSDLGYPVGAVDGVWGPDTQLAVNLFQCAIGYTERNYATASMLKKLNAKDAPVYDPCMPLKEGDKGTTVLIMQTTLQLMGYDPGKLDGKYGPATVAAVTEFQTIANLPVTGEATRETLELLYSPDCPLNPSIQPSGTAITAVVLEGNIAQPRVGDVLTAKVRPSNATVTYAWYRTGSNVVIGTDASYTVQPEDMSCAIYCTVVGTGDFTGVITSSPTGLASSTDMVP